MNIMRRDGIIFRSLTYNNDLIKGYDVTMRRDYRAGYRIRECHTQAPSLGETMEKTKKNPYSGNKSNMVFFL
jgi:hypothetical protein